MIMTLALALLTCGALLEDAASRAPADAPGQVQSDLGRGVRDDDFELAAGFIRDPRPGEVFGLRAQESPGQWVAFEATSDGVRTRLAVCVGEAGRVRTVDFAEVPASPSGLHLALTRDLDRFRCDWSVDGEVWSPCFELHRPLVVNRLVVLPALDAVASASNIVSWVRAPWGTTRAPEERVLASVPIGLLPTEVLIEELWSVDAPSAWSSLGEFARAIVAEPELAPEAPSGDSAASRADVPSESASEPAIGAESFVEQVTQTDEPSAPVGETTMAALDVAAELAPTSVALESFGSGALASLWSFEGAGAGVALAVDAAGVLTFSVPAGSEHQTFGRSRAPSVLTALPSEDFELHTEFTSDVRGVGRGYRSEGLVLELADGRWLRFEVIGEGVRIWASLSLVDGARHTSLGLARLRGEAPWRFELVREGEAARCVLRDGARALVFDAELTAGARGARRVGVFAGNAFGAGAPAHTARVSAVRLALRLS